MSDSEHRRVVPFYWLVILVLAALLAVAVFLLLRPNPPASEVPPAGQETSEDPGEGPEPSPEPEPDETDDQTGDDETETGPLRAKLTDAVAGFEVKSWVESAGLLKYGAEEAYEGFYVPVGDGSEIDLEGLELTGEGVVAAEEDEALAPTLIAAGRWESADAAHEWLTEFASEQAVLPPDLIAEGQVPSVQEDPVGTYRYFESPDGAEAAVVWTNQDLGLLLAGQPQVVELLFTQLPL